MLSACNPIPDHYKCNTPDFSANIIEVKKNFETSAYFSKHCQGSVPEIFTYKITPTSSLDIRVRGDWLDLRAFKDGAPISIEASSIKKQDYDGYTHMVNINSLTKNNLGLTLPDNITIELNFTNIECTCVTYDAI